MILPERVLGRLSPKRMSLGLAIGPISFADPVAQFLGDLMRARRPWARALQHHEGDDGFAGEIVRTAHHGRLGDQPVGHQRATRFPWCPGGARRR